MDGAVRPDLIDPLSRPKANHSTGSCSDAWHVGTRVADVKDGMGELLNLIGLSTGIVLYAMLLAMVVRAGRGAGRRPRFDPLLLATALLGLVWNLCALPAYELPKVGIVGPFPFLIAVGFSALGFLPAVVVQSVLRGERDAVRGGSKRRSRSRPTR